MVNNNLNIIFRLTEFTNLPTLQHSSIWTSAPIYTREKRNLSRALLNSNKSIGSWWCVHFISRARSSARGAVAGAKGVVRLYLEYIEKFWGFADYVFDDWWLSFQGRRILALSSHFGLILSAWVWLDSLYCAMWLKVRTNLRIFLHDFKKGLLHGHSIPVPTPQGWETRKADQWLTECKKIFSYSQSSSHGPNLPCQCAKISFIKILAWSKLIKIESKASMSNFPSLLCLD